MRNEQPLYGAILTNGERITLYSKAQLIELIKESNEIKQIEWYKGCGEWIDVTKKYKLK